MACRSSFASSSLSLSSSDEEDDEEDAPNAEVVLRADLSNCVSELREGCIGFCGAEDDGNESGRAWEGEAERVPNVGGFARGGRKGGVEVRLEGKGGMRGESLPLLEGEILDLGGGGTRRSSEVTGEGDEGLMSVRFV